MKTLLLKYRAEIGKVVALDLNAANVIKLDFSQANALLTTEALQQTETFDKLVNQMLQEKEAVAGIGGYLENRIIYRRSNLFEETEPRSMHLGIDIWTAGGTSVFAPLPGLVHSFQNNASFGDYGPTIILQHQLEDLIFYTLYGHLNVACLEDLKEGQTIEKGQRIAAFGPFPENGDWPPHLHFQLITDLKGMRGDFPGVCKPSEKESFATSCPDPNLILQSRHL
ncbi:peptidoglycan DD-metalloendopeptidase family protein [Adhaeribacter terrigena]|uniref:peptidoglycan DD-metalloendopeptidase family protein n=1 Tax=Adhaeribacter terrigena TaxID=2793070 RepID=UPI001F46DC28|nr:peptidoglycan DD-metalloendopeptidase family protein [Adhaeribacter terrigena]